MKQFRLLTRTRQVTEYSCGACELQAVLSYWGKDVDEEDLMKVLHTTSEEGTYPENIVRGARALGFEAEAKDKLTLDEVEQFTANGDPMIALAQVWRSEKNSPGAVSEDWDNGHYIVVLKRQRVFSGPLCANEQGLHASQDVRGALASGDGRRLEEEPKTDAAWNIRQG